MINHVRTLILNSQNTFFDGSFGQIYIPPAFRPVTLDSHLQRIKNLLIPQGLDATGQNYAAAAVMQILHSPELEDYTLVLDPRITYTANAELLAKACDMPVYITVDKSTGCDIVPKYRVVAGNQPTQMSVAGNHKWTFRDVTARSLRVDHSRGTEVTLDVVRGVNPTETQAIDLLPGYLKAYFELPSNELTGRYKITYETTVAVPYNLAVRAGELERVLAYPGYSDRIFGATGPHAATITELHDIWLNAAEIGLKFGSAALAYTFQCEKLRVADGG